VSRESSFVLTATVCGG